MSNRLSASPSPYLRQHAGNPVDWQPWDELALARARDTDTPILLSIGYSACHWCHVMAHESFENPGIAALMNARFICIKLDREERPDIDRSYQLAYQAMYQRGGGWPLTVFLDPQTLSPFFIGTYFPAEAGRGLPAFPDVLQQVRAFFDTHRGELADQAQALQHWLDQAQATTPTAVPDGLAFIDSLIDRGIAGFDTEWGGTPGAPKFPHETQLEWLLDCAADTRLANHGKAANMAQTTLLHMALHGLQDHLGGGFFRYCVDGQWGIPHFEKMLYNNAQLLSLYARTAGRRPAPDAAATALQAVARDAAQGIVDWLVRDMTDADGCFYSSQDADSEGEEGKFYLWTRAQIQTAIGDDPQREIFCAALGLDAGPNFEGRAWHLQCRDAEGYGVAHGGATGARERCLATRQQRIHPGRDDKVLTGWNALMISGLLQAGRQFNNAYFTGLARHALDGLRRSVWVNDALYANRAVHEWRVPAFLDDHALLLMALLDALQEDFQAPDLDWGLQIADRLIEGFTAPDGGFWFSSTVHGTPLARGRDFTDDVLPNGNATAIRALLRLGHLTGELRYLSAAEHALQAASGALQRYPEACPTLLRALREYREPRTQLVVRAGSAELPTWRRAVQTALEQRAATPSSVPESYFIPSECEPLPGLLTTRTACGPAGTAYLCSGLSCRAPINDPGELVAALQPLQR
ncbi:MAG TPA: thioredoxin domain-containing protein [Nevskiaceae bacterium]|nr:thioredoxin domain-containing protein [Nevskiaceae bacterium]